MYNKIGDDMDLLNKIANIVIIIAFLSMLIYNSLINNISTFNGELMIVLLFILLNPFLNLFRTNKKEINNIFYKIVIILTSLWITFEEIKAIYVTITESGYESQFVWSNRFFYSFIALLICHILTFIFKKENVSSKKDKTGYILFILFIEYLVLITSNFYIKNTYAVSLLSFPLNLLAFLLVIYIWYIRNNINSSKQIINLYGILLITNILSINIIGIILTIMLYNNFDKYGTFL